jgi:hypothetical protein
MNSRRFGSVEGATASSFIVLPCAKTAEASRLILASSGSSGVMIRICTAKRHVGPSLSTESSRSRVSLASSKVSVQASGSALVQETWE